MKAFAKALLRATTPRLLYRYQIFQARHSEAELSLLPWLCKEDAVSVDIGANRGLYTRYMLRYSGSVVAFEPLPEMHARLEMLFGDSISLYRVALSDREGACNLRMPRGSPSWATIETHNSLSLAGNTELQTHTVRMAKLDDFHFSNVGLIKIDVEGHEEAVVQGGVDTIYRNRPRLIIEIEERHNPGAFGRVSALLAAKGYQGFFYDDGNYHSVEGFLPERDQPVENLGLAGRKGRYINNFVFAPWEKPLPFSVAGPSGAVRR